MKARTEKTVFHAVSVLILVASLLFSVFYFTSVLARTVATGKEFGVSVAYMFTEPFGMKGRFTPTVNNIPANAVEVLPFEPAEFLANLKEFGRLLITWSNLKYFLYSALVVVAIVISYGAPLVLIIIAIKSLLKFKPKTVNNDYNKDTKPLQIFKQIESATWIPLRSFIKRYVEFVRERKTYWILACIVWAYNLNLFTIALEIVAYLCYLVISWDFLHVLTLIAKVAMDLTVALDFIPVIVWIVIAWCIFEKIRRNIGLNILREYEFKNRSFLQSMAGSIYIIGKQRSKKTTIVADMTRTQELIFRDQALEDMRAIAMQFPHFPWINLENSFKIGKSMGVLITEARCRLFIKTVRRYFEDFELNRKRKHTEAIRKGILRHKLRDVYGYSFKDFIFEYDYKRYGIEHNDGLVMVNIFDAISDYIQLYWIYTLKTSLAISNFPIRRDVIWTDLGNFPIYDGDFFDRRPEELAQISDYSHVLDWNSLRLGRITDDNDPLKDGLEVYIMSVMEFAKERGNQRTNAGKKIDADECNVRNDGYEEGDKMKGHSGTIHYYDYTRKITDDQRAGSLSSDNRELCNELLVQDGSKQKNVYPLLWIDDLVYRFCKKIYDKYDLDHRVRRGDNTLWGYLLKKLFTPILHRQERLQNEFRVYPVSLRVSNGQTNEIVNKRATYYVMSKKAHSGVFATDGIKDFFNEKALRSDYGLDDFPTFQSVRMTTDEMQMMNSFFYDRLFDYFYETDGATA